jgi:hypothetical protein
MDPLKNKIVNGILLMLCVALPCNVASAENGKKAKVGAQLEIKEEGEGFKMTLKYSLDKPVYVLSPSYTAFTYAEHGDETDKPLNIIMVVEFWPPAQFSSSQPRRWKNRNYVLVHNGDSLTYVLSKNEICSSVTERRGVDTLQGKFLFSFIQHYLPPDGYARYQRENSARNGFINFKKILSKNYESNQIEVQLNCLTKPVHIPKPWPLKDDD